MKLVDFAISLVYMATYVVVVPILVAIYFYKYQSKPLKILLVGLVCVLFFDVLMLFFEAKNTFLYIFSGIDALMMAGVFSVAVTNQSTGKVILGVGFLFVPIIVLDAFFWSGLENNGYSNALEKVFVLATVIYYLTQLLQDVEIDNLWQEPLIWVSVSVLVYNLVGLLDVFSNPMLNYSKSLYLQFYMIWCIAALFMNGCFAYAFWRSKYKSQL
jgi:hypothetical protein